MKVICINDKFSNGILRKGQIYNLKDNVIFEYCGIIRLKETRGWLWKTSRFSSKISSKIKKRIG